jgi:SAM-dependent methyltransferase
MRLHAQYSTNKRGLHPWVFDHLDLPAGSRVLEVGCGSGRLWLENRARIPGDWRVILGDLSGGMVRQARQALQQCGRPFDFVALDAQALPFPDGYFDALIANHMLYHVPNRQEAYSEFRRVLKPGGRLFAATNGRHTMVELDDLLHRFIPLQPGVRPFGNYFNDSFLDSGFNLEHGGAELSRWFALVSLHRYYDALIVPKAEPLVAYVRASTDLPEDLLGEIRRYLDNLIARTGPLRISKDVGMFEAQKAGLLGQLIEDRVAVSELA